MKSEVRIPTLLGLGVLLVGIAAGVFLVTANQVFKSNAAASSAPKNVRIVNVSDTHVSVSWQTDTPSSGFIQAGTSSTLGTTFRDERDQDLPQKHTLHFATLTGLTPDTIYYYKITSGTLTYPNVNFYSFKTASLASTAAYPALIGQVLNSNHQPIPEALVSLTINGAQELSAITKMAGNFILPLNEIRTQTLEKSFTASSSTASAKLIIFDGSTRSEITLPFPPKGVPLPPLVLGENLDLTIESSPSAQLNLPAATPSATLSGKVKPKITGDLNGDGLVNSLDRIILIQNYGKNPKIKAADLNNDGVVDQKDLGILTQITLKNSSKR